MRDDRTPPLKIGMRFPRSAARRNKLDLLAMKFAL
jgi:hypothetical protein